MLCYYCLQPSQDFVLRLKNHLLDQLLETGDDLTDYTQQDRQSVIIINDTLYRHKCLRINFTTYDNRREQDTINPHGLSDIMVLNNGAESSLHPYQYGRVLGVFHLDVQHSGPRSTSQRPQRFDVLWVRWFALDEEVAAGFKAKRPFQVGFPESDDPLAYGFISPNDVIRAVHLTPVFAREQVPGSEDWWRYYVNL